MSTALGSRSNTHCCPTTHWLGFLWPSVSLAVLIIVSGPMGAISHAQLIPESSGWLNNLRPPTPFADGSSSFTYSEPSVTQYRASGYTAAADVSIQGTATSLQVPNTTSSPAYRLYMQGPGVAIISGNSSALVENQGASGGWPYSYSRASATGAAGYWNGFQQVTVASWGSYVEVRAGQVGSDSGNDTQLFQVDNLQQRYLDIGANPSVRAVNAYPSAVSAISSATANTIWTVAFVPGNSLPESQDQSLDKSVVPVPFDVLKPATVKAVFQPNFNLTLREESALCGVDHFNWVQKMKLPQGFEVDVVDRTTGALVSQYGNGAWISDPFGNSIDYAYVVKKGDVTMPVFLQDGFRDTRDYYFGEDEQHQGEVGHLSSTILSDSQLSFFDAPRFPVGLLGPGEYVEFMTMIVGVKEDGSRLNLDVPGTTIMWSTNAVADYDPALKGLILAAVDDGTLPPVVSGCVFNVRVVPEPSTLVLLSVGIIGLFGCAWRRRKQTA